LASCQKKEKSISFYYWRTHFHLDSTEQKTIGYNNVNTLYVRYFDVDFAATDSSPKPLAPIVFDTTINNLHIIPVVYFRNRVFERTDSAGIIHLAQNILLYISQINRAANCNPSEIQFDCDWTEKSKSNFFLFLRTYRNISKQVISATIRLHQIKYRSITGIPPVDRGVLMYYNMGEINAANSNSIYEKSIAEKYNSYIKTYPLQLDIALPIFTWGQQVRDGKVVKLLNKMNFMDFKNDSNFIVIKKDWFATKHSCFKSGYYFVENDKIKIENTSGDDLLEMADDIRNNSNHKTGNLIFYDLDKTNLILYDQNIFKETVHRIY
jgi:hypothetical protein